MNIPMRKREPRLESVYFPYFTFLRPSCTVLPDAAHFIIIYEKAIMGFQNQVDQRPFVNRRVAVDSLATAGDLLSFITCWFVPF